METKNVLVVLAGALVLSLIVSLAVVGNFKGTGYAVGDTVKVRVAEGKSWTFSLGGNIYEIGVTSADTKSKLANFKVNGEVFQNVREGDKKINVKGNLQINVDKINSFFRTEYVYFTVTEVEIVSIQPSVPQQSIPGDTADLGMNVGQIYDTINFGGQLHNIYISEAIPKNYAVFQINNGEKIYLKIGESVVYIVNGIGFIIRLNTVQDSKPDIVTYRLSVVSPENRQVISCPVSQLEPIQEFPLCVWTNYKFNPETRGRCDSVVYDNILETGEKQPNREAAVVSYGLRVAYNNTGDYINNIFFSSLEMDPYNNKTLHFTPKNMLVFPTIHKNKVTFVWEGVLLGVKIGYNGTRWDMLNDDRSSAGTYNTTVDLSNISYDYIEIWLKSNHDQNVSLNEVVWS
ncbi:MAG TPA: hypothetical protein VJH65_00540 [Candidatus Nanoarchaeia archaeon]|nr:hypothetical protein [Candidatus Nanoarchaeia archaeon]